MKLFLNFDVFSRIFAAFRWFWPFGKRLGVDLFFWSHWICVRRRPHLSGKWGLF